VTYIKSTLLLSILWVITISIHASDYNPPDWRGQKNSSYQIWRFDFNEDEETGIGGCQVFNSNITPWGQRSTPDRVDNPFEERHGICSEYQTPWMISGKMDWQREHDLRNGVWMLSSDRRFPVFMNFMIANADQIEGSTEIYVQLVHQITNGSPKLILRYPADEPELGFYEIQAEADSEITVLPFDWRLQLFRFEMNTCPLYQIIQISPPDSKIAMYLDEVVVDTICKISS
jgi:hypothetical protein